MTGREAPRTGPPGASSPRRPGGGTAPRRSPGRLAGWLWVLGVLLSHWRRRPGQLATLLLGLAIATALWSGVEALNEQARASYDRAARAFQGAGMPALVAAEGGDLDEALFGPMRRAGWQVSPVIEGRIRIGGAPFRLIGIEPVSLPPEAGLSALGGGEARGQGFTDFVLPPGRTLAAPETLQRLGLAEGAVVATDDGRRLPPLARSGEIAPGLLATDIGFAQSVLGREGRVSRFLLGEGEGAPLEGVTATPLSRVAPEPGRADDMQRLTESFHLNLTAFGLLAFMVGLFIVHSAIGLAVEQRLAMFRTLRACGVSALGLTGALLAELMTLAAVAGLAGVAAGWLIALALLPDVAATLRGLYGAEVSGVLALGAVWWLSGLAISLAGALAAAAAGLLRVHRLPVLESAAPRAWEAASRRRIARLGLAALGLIALAAALAASAEGLETAFAAMGCLLLGAALALPAVIGRALIAAEAVARRPVVQWFWADTRQQLPALSLALMALLLALGVNIGVGTMVGSFRTAFTGWLDGRLAAEAYVRPASGAEAARVIAWLAARPEVTAVLPSRAEETRIAGWPVELQGFTPHATYRERWPTLAVVPGGWDAVASGTAALVSEQLARRAGLRIGDAVSVPTPTGDWHLDVAGIYPDYGNPKGQVRVALGAFEARWPEGAPNSMGIRADPAAVPALLSALAAETGMEPANMVDQAALKRESTAIFERTFTVTAALNTLTLGVAGVALMASLMTLAAHRLPQLAPLWALGLTRRRLALIEILRILALAALTALVAIPLGLAVAWLLVAVVNVAAFGWRLPLHVFPADWAALAALSLAAALVASLSPVLRLARTPPARLLRIFADER
ncbi:FtsX-like permease family protein [Limibaculum sp. FT325]|uniref:ABC transporter permease n=1 Tax=Thermohalobaculum sediminis TaxID=2939436 RepID=UPI0020BFB05D|nr:FtsX-like permease family protein [Limibaculum sediminis]MCL5777018.1 FtsX-like permease family protein [Limibaculum sediminis]